MRARQPFLRRGGDFINLTDNRISCVSVVNKVLVRVLSPCRLETRSSPRSLPSLTFAAAWACRTPDIPDQHRIRHQHGLVGALGNDWLSGFRVPALPLRAAHERRTSKSAKGKWLALVYGLTEATARW